MKIYASAICFAVLVCVGCTSPKTSENSLVDNCNVIGERIAAPFPVTECKLNRVKDKITFPLSRLVTDFKLVRLSNSAKETMVSGNDKICLSDNYIAVYGSGSQITKLFDGNGNFITNVGSIGNGPGEYAPWAETAQIDEENGIIYQTTIANQDGVNAYSLKDGRFIKKIPLAEKGNRARLRVDTGQEQIDVLQVPMPHTSCIVWKQDFSGKRIASVPSANYPSDGYTNSEYGWNPGCVEPVLGRHKDKVSVGFIHYFPAKDSLYYFEGNKLIPYFTVDYADNGNVPYHTVDESGRYFLITLYANDGQIFKKLDKRVIMDRQTLKGGEVELLMDELGNIPVDFIPTFQDGYFYYNISPEDLEGKITKALQSSGLAEDERDKLNAILDNMTPDDNNYLIIGKCILP